MIPSYQREMPLGEIFADMTTLNFWINVLVVGIGLIVAVTSFALLLPLDSVAAVSGVSVIISVAFGLSLLAWVTAVAYYSRDPQQLTWLNTHLIFLVLLPTVISATAMNVTAIQNTRNLIAGKVSA
jgi:phosphoglycerol transferase MdoB-like AlkP superfamily enzyme